MRVIILLEGIDKTGKTTEAERLTTLPVDLGKVATQHFGVPTEGNPFEEYRSALRMADEFEGSTVIDRLHWSDEAYGQVYRQDSPSLLSPAQIEELDVLLEAIGGIVVLKTRPIIDIAKAMNAEDYGHSGHHESDLDHVRILKQVFLRRYAGSLCPKTIIPFGSQISLHFLEHAARLTVHAAKHRGLEVVE